MVAMLAIASTLVLPACHRDRGRPLRTIIFVPAGYFRAQTLCAMWFDRACKLSYEPPIGKRRHRVMMWLDAFWADTELVTRSDYDACRAAGGCQAPQNPPDTVHATDECGYNLLAIVHFGSAVAYCQWRGWRLPTPDEFERMARWTDGRLFAAGVAREGWRMCERRPSPDGIRSLNLTDQWVATEDHPVLMGGTSSTTYNEVESDNFTAPFRCVRSAYPTPTPGLAQVAPDQIDRWLLGGPDG